MASMAGRHPGWLDRLWQAMADDGVDYLSPVADRWGEICGSAEIAGRWADELVSTLRDAGPGQASTPRPRVPSGSR
jgi:hypothetical protein